MYYVTRSLCSVGAFLSLRLCLYDIPASGGRIPADDQLVLSASYYNAANLQAYLADVPQRSHKRRHICSAMQCY